MYAGALLIVFAMPLTLGSPPAELRAVAMLGAIVVRLLDEERFLERYLPGYAGYERRTRYRLLPGVW